MKEPATANVLLSSKGVFETFNYYIYQKYEDGSDFYSLDCALASLSSMKESLKDLEFYYKFD